MHGSPAWGPYVSPDPYGPARPHEWQHGDGSRPDLSAPPRPYAVPALPAAGHPADRFGPPMAWPPRPYPRVRPPGYDRYAFVAPLIATLLGAPLIAFDAIIALFSPMATDSCTAHGCQALDRMLLLAPVVLALAAASLGVCWLLPWRVRHRVPRIAAALAAPLLAVTTILIYTHLPAAN